jgi:hypothetical protein
MWLLKQHHQQCSAKCSAGFDHWHHAQPARMEKGFTATTLKP